MKLSKYKINYYNYSDLCLILTLNGRGYITKKYKKEFIQYMYDNQDNITFYFNAGDCYLYDSNRKSNRIEHLAYCIYNRKYRQLRQLNKEFIKEYYTNYFNMKIIYMTTFL